MHKVEAKRRSALACELSVVLRNAISPTRTGDLAGPVQDATFIPVASGSPTSSSKRVR